MIFFIGSRSEIENGIEIAFSRPSGIASAFSHSHLEIWSGDLASQIEIGFEIGYVFALFGHLVLVIVIESGFETGCVVVVYLASQIGCVVVDDLASGYEIGDDLDLLLVDDPELVVRDERNLLGFLFRPSLCRQDRRLRLQHRACRGNGRRQIHETLHVCPLECKHRRFLQIWRKCVEGSQRQFDKKGCRS